jgi:Putative phage tail protein
MATLILSTVGGIFGGKAGRAVGAVVGNLIDRKLFAPKGRQGPRLGDLAFQSSQYGALIPKLYGINRVSGTVIWATDLREDRKKVSNGKGQPKTTTFSYSASFAVALSARRVLRVGRIWADGNLLRGAAGDFKVATGFRLHHGGEDQGVDPLIASAEGVEQAPAYRGLAYVVFENLQLGDFGNRIPSLSFEVIADEGDVSVGTIVEDLAGRAVAADCPTRVGGYAAFGDAVRGAVETLGSVVAFSAYDDGTRLRVFETGAQASTIAEDDLGTARGEERAAHLPIERRSASTIPETLSITYYEPSRDYQQGVQRARRDGGARREAKIELPVVLAPEVAKQIAERQLNQIWAARVEARVRLPWRRLDLVPGQRVVVAGNPALWRVDAVNLDRMVVEADLVRLSEGGAVVPKADPGRSLIQNDGPHGRTWWWQRQAFQSAGGARRCCSAAMAGRVGMRQG